MGMNTWSDEDITVDRAELRRLEEKYRKLKEFFLWAMNNGTLNKSDIQDKAIELSLTEV